MRGGREARRRGGRGMVTGRSDKRRRSERSSGSRNRSRKVGRCSQDEGIPFSESEWEEVKRAATAHEMPAAEFVRKRILALARARASESVEPGPVPGVDGAAERAVVVMTRRDCRVMNSITTEEVKVPLIHPSKGSYPSPCTGSCIQQMARHKGTSVEWSSVAHGLISIPGCQPAVPSPGHRFARP